MISVTYDYYQNTYKGKLSEEQFSANLPKAQDLVAGLLTGEPEGETQTEAVERALCYALDYQQSFDTSDENNFTSEHSDDYSYTRDTSQLQAGQTGQLNAITGLLQRAGLYSARVHATW